MERQNIINMKMYLFAAVSWFWCGRCSVFVCCHGCFLFYLIMHGCNRVSALIPSASWLICACFFFLRHKRTDIQTYCAFNLQSFWLTLTICCRSCFLTSFRYPFIFALLSSLICILQPRHPPSHNLSFLSAGCEQKRDKGTSHACSDRWCLLGCQPNFIKVASH